MNSKKDSHNKTRRYFHEICKQIYYMGAPNIWFEELQVPVLITKIHGFYSNLTNIIVVIFIVLEWAALYTQDNLSEKQITDLKLFCFSHPFLFSYPLNLSFYKDKMKELLLKLTVDLKEIYNDEDVERQMLKRAKFFSAIYMSLISMALVFYGLDAILQIVNNDGTFITVITAWPDVEDKTRPANVARIVIYLVWWVYMMRVSTAFSLIIPVTVCLSHQYKILQSYFYSLNYIFEGNLQQKESEKKFEEGFKIGIKFHSDILWCTRRYQETCQVVFGGQILVNVTVMVLLMLQLVGSERTLANTLTIMSTAAAMLISTGCLMWNAGDITVAASHLTTAMFSSGWHNCTRESSGRARTLLLFAMWQSQRPVELRCLGIVKLSYGSYLSIVKWSYSVFSVFY